MAVGMFLLSQMGIGTTSATAIRNMVITGFGLGITMPLYTIAVQNAVPYKILGTATSSTAFFRSIGGSVGLAVFGSVLNNRFTAELAAKLPDAVKSILPPQQLDILMHNPQALMSPDAQSQLHSTIVQIGQQGETIFQQVMQSLRQSLDVSISHVFLYGMFVIVLAFIINFFIKEIPLRQHYHIDSDHLTKKSG
jgi:hypothetical protein